MTETQNDLTVAQILAGAEKGLSIMEIYKHAGYPDYEQRANQVEKWNSTMNKLLRQARKNIPYKSLQELEEEAYGLLEMHPWDLGRYTLQEYMTKKRGFDKFRAIKKKIPKTNIKLDPLKPAFKPTLVLTEQKIPAKIETWRKGKDQIGCAAFCELLYTKKYFDATKSNWAKACSDFAFLHYNGIDIINSLRTKRNIARRKLIGEYKRIL